MRFGAGFWAHSKPWKIDGSITLVAIALVNSVLAATGLRPLAITKLSKWGPDYEGVTVDPEDWRSGRTQSEIEAGVKGDLSNNDDSILLHSRLKKHMSSFGPYLSGAVAIGIFQMAAAAGRSEVMNFAAEIKATKITTKDGEIPMSNWLDVYPEWTLFTTFFENWMTNKPFPHIKGVTI